MNYLLGQFCGILGMIFTILQPQCKRKQNMLLCCILVNGFNAANFFLLGQTGSSVLLCLVAVVQALLGIHHERRQTEVSRTETLVFFALYLGFGFYGLFSSEGFVWAVNRHNLLELLPIVGALMLMLSVFAKDEQRTRGFLFLNGASWLVYSAMIGSTVVFSCVICMLSTSLALWKYRKQAVS